MDHLLFKSPILKLHLEKMEAWIASSSAKYLDLPWALSCWRGSVIWAAGEERGVTAEG